MTNIYTHILDAAAEIGKNPAGFSLSMEMGRLARDGTAEPVSRDQTLRRERGQGYINFPCSADHEQDWQPYPVDPSLAVCNADTYIHTYESWKYVFITVGREKQVS